MDTPLYPTDWLPGDEADMSSLGSAMGRRVSVDTVATELWLRPGTSDAVKQWGCSNRINRRMGAPHRLKHCIAQLPLVAL